MPSKTEVDAVGTRRVAFEKMHGLGNDFVVLDASAIERLPDASAIRQLAARRTGIGFDQMMVLETTTEPFHYRVFNADGSEVEQCGNGARCLARYIARHNLVESDTFAMQSRGSTVRAQVLADRVSISLGTPGFAPQDLPFRAPTKALTYDIDIDGHTVTMGAVSVGNPHAVILVNSVDDAPIAVIGPRLETHPRFPQRVNVGFIEIVSAHECRLRVHERGVGETPACGTGAAAAAVWAIAAGKMNTPVTVALTGGELQVDWKGGGVPVWLTGPATPVFQGVIPI